MTGRQLGKFIIRAHIVKKNPEHVAKVFSMLKLVPVRCEYLFENNSFEYIAISERFRIVPECEMVPSYQIKITDDSAGWPSSVEVIPYD